ncbi:MAG TPA: aldo/keto reductase [Acidimicrobiales bacterium]|nr:aldo/keto reductase [Acidimicrobiales bacterium]
MDYRQLGRTGVRVSPLCLGAMNFGGVTDETESIATIHAALDAGINFVDTANVYSRGASESVVGKALKGRRDEVVLATKVHGAMGEGPNDNGNSRRHVKMQCEASLRRLQTDWIDLYQLHRPDDQTPIEETLEALDELVREGKVNYVGVSTFPAWQTMEAIGHAERWRLRSRPVCEQPPYNLLDRRVERDVVPLALKHGLGIIPWSPLASGVLSGKYSGGTIPEGSRLANYGITDADERFAPTLAKVQELEKIAANAGVGILPLALAWLMAQPGVTSPIIGPRDRQQLAANLAAVEVKVDDGVRAAIDEVSRPGRAILAL